MRIRGLIISLIAFLCSFSNAFAQIEYDLNLSTCVINDTLYITVTAEDVGGTPFGFGSSNFVFDIVDAGGNIDTSLIQFTQKFIAQEGLWSSTNPAGNPDYQNMLLGSTSDFFNLTIVEDDVGQAGVQLTGGVDTVGVIGVPMRGNWCGDTIRLLWRDPAVRTWPGFPFAQGTITQWDATSTNIFPNANFIMPAPFVLCPGCGSTSAAVYTLLPGDSIVCEGETIVFSTNPAVSSGDSVTFYVDGVPIQSSLADTFAYTFLTAGINLVHAVVGSPSCPNCAAITDTNTISINSATLSALNVSFIGCDSIHLEVEDIATSYTWYKNGLFLATTLSPIAFYEESVALNDSFSVELIGAGICPSPFVLDTVITNLSAAGITVDLGPTDTTICSGDNLVLNSGFTPNPPNVNIDWYEGASLISTDVASIAPSVQGTYYAVVDSFGCVGIDSINVWIGNATAEISAIDTFICSGNSLTLSQGPSTSGATIEWFENPLAPVLLGNGSSINVTTAGTYFLVASTSINGITCSDTAFQVITISSCAINASFTHLDTVCIFSANTIILSNNSVGDTAWLWTFGSGSFPSTSTDSFPTIPVTYATGGLKTITLIVWGPNGSDTTTSQIFVRGQMGSVSLNTGAVTSNSVEFTWNNIVNATSYQYYVGIKPNGASSFTYGSTNPIVGTNFTVTGLNPLDSVCFFLIYANSCYQDTISKCFEVGASNCNVTANIAYSDSVCRGEPICFDINTVVLPNTNGITDPDNWSVVWNDDISTDGDSTYCISDASLLLPGNHCIPYTIYSTDPGSNCYAQSFICYTVFDTTSGILDVNPLSNTSSAVTFGWNAITGALEYQVNYRVVPAPFSGWVTPDPDGTGGAPADPTATTHTVKGLTKGKIVILTARAISDNHCDTLYSSDTVQIIANDSCFIGYLNSPDLFGQCGNEDFILSVAVTQPSDWEVNWNNSGFVPYDTNYTINVAPNTNVFVPFEIRDISTPSCFVQDTIDIQTEPAEDPSWDVNNEYCLTDNPIRIDYNRVTITGTFRAEAPTNPLAVRFVNGNWYFYPSIAGVGSHTITHVVCGAEASDIFIVSDVPCVSTPFADLGSRPDGIYTTCSGDVYFSDTERNSIWRIRPNGVRTKVLGNSTLTYKNIVGQCTDPGPSAGYTSNDIDDDVTLHRSIARVACPRGLVVIESTGVIYFNDSKNHKVKKYDPATQEVSTVVGPSLRFASDVPAGNSSTEVTGDVARLAFPWGMAKDCDDNNLYITERNNAKVKRIKIPDGGTFGNTYLTSNLVGGGATALAGAGPLNWDAVQFGSPFPSHPSTDGRYLYIPDPTNFLIARYNFGTAQIEEYMAQSFDIGVWEDGIEGGIAGTGNIIGPVTYGSGVAVKGGAPYIYWSDNGDYAVRTIGDDDTIRTVAGSPPPNRIAGDDGGAPFLARFGSPTAMSYSVDNFLYVCDAYDGGAGQVGSIRKIAFGPESLGPFGTMDSIYCLNGPQDTLISPYAVGTYTVTQGDPSVLTQFGVSDTFFFNPIIADTFILHFSGQSLCCSIEDSFMVIVLPPPAPMLDSIIFSCDPASTIVTPDSIHSNWLYTWTDSNGVFLSSNDTLFGVGEGSYYLEVLDTVSGCIGFDSTRVQVGFSDTLIITGTNTMCFGDSVLLSIDTTGFQNWWWNTGDSTHEIYASASGDYIAFGSVGACFTTDTFRVTANPLPVICITAAVDTAFGRWNVGTLAGDTVSAAAGTPAPGYVDAQGYNARFDSPWDVLYVNGFLYVTEGGNNNLVRRIDLSDTTVTTFAGRVGGGITTDSLPRLNSQFIGPTGIAYNKDNGDFYFSNDVTNTLLRIHNDSIFIIAGQNGFGTGYLEGGVNPRNAIFSRPKDLDIDAFGGVYMADYDNHIIRKYNPQDNTLFTLTGSPSSAGIVNGPAGTAQFTWPWGVGRTKSGGWVVPTESHNVRHIDQDIVTSTLAGPGSLNSGFVDAVGSAARFNNPWNVYVCPQGNAYMTDGNNASVRVVDMNGNTLTIAGNPPSTPISGFADGDQDIARFWVPTGITSNSATGMMYIADRANHLIRTLWKNKNVTSCESTPDTLNASCSLTGSELDYYWVDVNGDTLRQTSIVADTSGTYYFHVVNANGCSNSDSVVVNVIPTIDPNINLMTAGRLDSVFGCQGDTIILEAQPFGYETYNWTSTSPFTGLATDSIISTDTSGRYILEVTNAAGCSSFDTVDVIITSLPILPELDSNLCFGETYTIDLSIYGFDSVIWNGNLDTMLVVLDSTGIYAFEGFLNGCSLLDTVNLYVADSIFVNINGGGDTLFACLGDSLLLEALPYGFGSYLWSPGGETDSAIYVNAAGTYSVTVTDSVVSRCSASDMVVVEFIPAPVLGLPDTIYVCFGDSVIFSPSAGNLPVGLDSIIWSSGDTILSNTDSVIISTTGVYYATGILGSCIDYDSVFIFILNDITLSLNFNALNCGIDTLPMGGTPTASGGSGQGFLYNWSPGVMFDDSTAANPNLIFDTTGTYTFTLTVADSANTTCFKDTTFQIFYQEIPDAIFIDDTAICNGEQICFDFTADGILNIVLEYQGPNDLSFQFTGGVLGPAFCFSEANLSPSGGREVTFRWSTVVTTPGPFGNCVFSNVDTFNVIFADPMPINAGLDTLVCPNDSVVLGGSPTASGGSIPYVPGSDYVYSWTSSGVITPNPVANPFINPADSATYTLIVTDTIAGCRDTATVMVDVYPIRTVDAGTDMTICVGDSTVLNGSILPANDPSLTVNWSPNVGTLNDSTILNPTATPIDTTTYYLSVSDTIGCSSEFDSVTVNVNAIPIAAAQADTVCADSINTLTSNSIGILSWTTSGQATQTGSPVTYNFGTAGTYNVTLIADNGGCADTLTIPVVVDSLPIISAGPDASYCIIDTAILSGAFGAGNITWTTSTGGTFSNSSTINPTFTPDTTGTDSLTLLVVDGNGCRSSDQAVLTFSPEPLSNTGLYTAGCSGTGITLSAATGVGSFIWTTTGDGTFITSDSMLNPNYSFGTNDLANGGVTLTLTATSGACTPSSSAVTIGINPSAVAIISASVSGGQIITDSLVEIFLDEGVTFNYDSSLNFLPDSIGWDLDGDGVIDDFNNIYTEIFTEVRSGYLYLYASNEFGCYDWDTIRIDVIGNQVVFIPNVFDVTNETSDDISHLKVYGTNVLDNDAFDFKVYNRWGDLVFEEPSFEIMNTLGWDGTHITTGELQSLGVYTYTVRGEFIDGTTFEKVGNVTLIR